MTARCRASAATPKPSFVRHDDLLPDIPPEAHLGRRSVYWPRIAGTVTGAAGTTPAVAAAGGSARSEADGEGGDGGAGGEGGDGGAGGEGGDALPGRLDTPIYDGHRLVPGNGIEGPAVVELDTTTVVVHPGQSLRMDAYGNFELFPGGPDPNPGPDRASAH